MTDPLRPADPRHFGSFGVRGRLAQHAAGVVFAAYDPAGRPVAVTVLHSGAAADATVRTRFARAVDGLALRERGRVLAAEFGAESPWAALADDGAGAAHGPALRLLEAAAQPGGAPPTGEWGRHSGPEFAPHWTGTAAADTIASAAHHHAPAAPGSPPDAVRPANTRRSPAILAVAVVAALAVVVGGGLAASLWLDGRDARSAGTAPAPPYPGGSPDADVPTVVPTALPTLWPRTPSPEPTWTGADGPDGPVAGPTFGVGEPTVTMNLAGLPFQFRLPSSWGCLRSARGGQGVVRWVCVDDSYALSGKPGTPPGGIIEVSRCPAPCDGTAWAKVRDQLPRPQSDWRRTDDTTTYADWSVGAGDELQVSVAMSHVFAATRGGPVDQHVAVRLTGAPEDKKTLQKVVNEVRARTP
ncbi:hypothetical protein [Actinopolymorpha singaporensis]|uniref:Uncharacterized protein n=1 Tax=Actinopolymorpha singaporensis TaxID=117157 RepID=A0A1H1W9I0_9ACTN|nr:hypothetical protein [Actinopolymorpha singaporensis]SDS93622.1 hypothetical protein SAMN04489717_4410 [Actinopolymorpha singaporensis]